MASSKRDRASMREGPLSELFRRTEKASKPEAESSPEPPAPEPEAIQATATPNWPAAKQEPTTTPGGPLVWLLDDQHNQASSSGAEGFAISGINTSDQAMQEVHAVLKPDGGQRELELALSVEGQKAEGVVPAGRRLRRRYRGSSQDSVGQ